MSVKRLQFMKHAHELMWHKQDPGNELPWKGEAFKKAHRFTPELYTILMPELLRKAECLKYG